MKVVKDAQISLGDDARKVGAAGKGRGRSLAKSFLRISILLL